MGGGGRRQYEGGGDGDGDGEGEGWRPLPTLFLSFTLLPFSSQTKIILALCGIFLP